mmetsp:Transcript_75872/g.191781  ORF Transcript_75872/g.191781 Transcript_75872/m.191781 type:complete len:280 (+) Transcript_75872:37-876(+)
MAARRPSVSSPNAVQASGSNPPPRVATCTSGLAFLALGAIAAWSAGSDHVHGTHGKWSGSLYHATLADSDQAHDGSLQLLQHRAFVAGMTDRQNGHTSQDQPSSCQLSATTLLFELVRERAELSREVAAAKVAEGGSPCVYDAAQETAVLERANTSAATLGFDVGAAVTFAQLQADCSKQLQAFWLHAWGAAPPKPNLTLDAIRAQLGRLNSEIFSSWKEVVESEWPAAGCTCLASEAGPLFSRVFSVDGACGQPLYRGMLLQALLSASQPPCRVERLT